MRPRPKPEKNVNPKLRAWIRQRPCDKCKKGAWDEIKGQWRNQASHVLKKATHPIDEMNLITHCYFCHMEFELWSPRKRSEMVPLAIELTEEFKGMK